jgi:hypothetical protein
MTHLRMADEKAIDRRPMHPSTQSCPAVGLFPLTNASGAKTDWCDAAGRIIHFPSWRAQAPASA